VIRHWDSCASLRRSAARRRSHRRRRVPDGDVCSPRRCPPPPTPPLRTTPAESDGCRLQASQEAGTITCARHARRRLSRPRESARRQQQRGDRAGQQDTADARHAGTRHVRQRERWYGGLRVVAGRVATAASVVAPDGDGRLAWRDTRPWRDEIHRIRDPPPPARRHDAGSCIVPAGRRERGCRVIEPSSRRETHFRQAGPVVVRRVGRPAATRATKQAARIEGRCNPKAPSSAAPHSASRAR